MYQPNLSQLQAIAHRQVEATADLTRRICEVPAPTGNEFERARFIASLWRERHYRPEIDEIGNVYTWRGKQDSGPVILLLAHIDTVFPQNTLINVTRDGDILRGPGIGDNCVSVASLFTIFDILDELQIETPLPIIAVANVGEEGLGNLRGARAAVERYRERLGAVLVIDGNLGNITHRAVGSKRWRINVFGPGGHSFGDFGTPSAIHGLGRIIAAIADLDVPAEPRTTYNVGIIEGGTSVNTIAARASAILDMRSTDVSALNHLAKKVRALIESRAGRGLRVEIEVLGERPAGERSQSDPLIKLAAKILTEQGIEPAFSSASTDANIPISLNIPSLCIGITQGENAHTLEEFLHIPPIEEGLVQLVRLCLESSKLFNSLTERA